VQTKRQARRRHDDELKAKVLAACDEPGASVAAVAQAHELNANLVHKWRRLRDARRTAPSQPAAGKAEGAQFVALALPANAAPILPAADAQIQVQLRRGATTVVVSWPSAAAGECAAWLRGLLR
jgi:transposase